MSETRLREIWRGIKKRTCNPNCKDYAHYHGRGITLCAEWMDFEMFKVWALSHGYRDDLTLDRVNNNKGYFPGNCRWVSRKHQALNRSTCTRYTMDGHTKTMSQWAEIYKIGTDLVAHRMKRGWSFEKAVKTPVVKKEEKK